MSTNINMQEFDRQQAEVLSSVNSNDEEIIKVDMDEFDRQQEEVSSSAYVKDGKNDDSMTEEFAIENAIIVDLDW